MRLYKKQSYELKNENGRTLFMTELCIFETGYFWDEGLLLADICENINLDAPGENELVFLEPKVKVHLPVDIEKRGSGIAEKKKAIERAAEKNIQADFTKKLEELSRMINALPEIERIYVPDFALDEFGNYDESFMRKELEKVPCYEPCPYACTMADYYSLLLVKSINEEAISPDTAHWEFECFDFSVNLHKEDFQFRDVKRDDVFDLMKGMNPDPILDRFDHPGSYVQIKSEDKEDRDYILAFLKPDKKAAFYFLVGNRD
jgi:hypothetical protein